MLSAAGSTIIPVIEPAQIFLYVVIFFYFSGSIPPVKLNGINTKSIISFILEDFFMEALPFKKKETITR
jgi:hypothetical protein